MGDKLDQNIASYFEQYLNADTIFQDKRVLQSHYVPDALMHRDDQVQTISRILAPSLRLERPSNLFIYGKTGTGKTVCARKITDQMQTIALKQNIPLKVLYINCKLRKIADTEYRLIAQLARMMNKRIPVTGLPTDEVYNILYETIDEEEQLLLIVLDEIDHLVKKTGDELIYNLTRINTELKKAQVSIIGISNDLGFANHLDPRVKSSLSEEELIFPPYNALQLQTILKERAKKAFKEAAITNGVIAKCAAYAAREHGDARRALELLRVSAEVAERDSSANVGIEHLDKAEQRIESERYIDLIKAQPKQYQAAMLSILLHTKEDNNGIFTGDIYDNYRSICERVSLRPLTQRRISDIIADLDMQGVINARVISKGRFGRTREITLALPEHLVEPIEKLLIEDLGL